MAVRALLWEKEGGEAGPVTCRACAHGCRIAEGGAGRCRVRVNRGGTLYSLSADRVAACNLDPVEKKPLYHFLPGTTTLSVGNPGCNMVCAFCQNHTLSQGPVLPFTAEPGLRLEDFAARAVASAREAGAASFSFTYSEPGVSPEAILALAPAAQEAGLPLVLVSNAYLGPAAMAAYRDLVRAANFDLKAYSDAFYAKLCGARLAPVLRTIAQAVSFGWWVEITTLLIPGQNDGDAELTALARFIREHLGAHVPWHISRFRPMFRMETTPPTPLASLDRARAIGLAEGLHFVYAGNVPGHEGENTFCPACGGLALSRSGYRTARGFDGRCPGCGGALPGCWAI